MFFKLCKYLVWVFDAGIWVSFLYCVIWANKEIGLQRSLTWIGLFAVEARWSHLPRLGQSRACKVAGVCLLFPAWGPCPDAIQVSHPCGANLLRQWKKKKGALDSLRSSHNGIKQSKMPQRENAIKHWDYIKYGCNTIWCWIFLNVYLLCLSLSGIVTINMSKSLQFRVISLINHNFATPWKLM